MCVFNKTEDDVQVTVAFHVDDLLKTSLSGSAIDAFLVTLRSKFNMHNFILKCV